LLVPGDAEGLGRQILALAGYAAPCRRLGDNGYRLTATEYNRNNLAAKYLVIIGKTARENITVREDYGISSC
jgi:hypothetical protein